MKTTKAILSFGNSAIPIAIGTMKESLKIKDFSARRYEITSITKTVS